MTLKLLSWNIWQGQHLSEIIDFLKTADADIIGLQEVSERDSSNTAAVIAHKLGYNFVYYRAIDKTRLGYPQGNAILTKFPILKSKCNFLSDLNLYKNTAESEPRIAVEAEININGKSLTVFTVHLAYSHKFQSSKMRDLQVDNLIKLLPNKQTMVLGDFNSHPDSSYMNKLNNHLQNTDADLTQPTWTIYPFDYEGFKETELKHRLDYIFVTKDIEVLDFEVGKSRGSDHLPIITTIEV